MRQLFLTLAAVAMVLLGLIPSSALAADASGGGIVLPIARPLSPNYGAAKAALDASQPQAVPVAVTVGNAPTALVKWKGVGPNNVTPSDSTGAIGPDRYIEVVNESIGVYDRTGKVLSSATEAKWTGFGTAASGDGQILFDIHDQRFYFVMLYLSGGSNQLGFGFSKTATPSASATDWCSYHSTFGAYGTAFPDYPKLGQTSDFLLVGINRFSNGTASAVYVGSDVAWATKPAAGVITTCPALSSMTTGVQASLLNADSSLASTPIPGRQTDSSGTGYVAANHDVSAGGSASSLSMFTVTKNLSTGLPSFSSATNVPVASYSMPPSVPQPGTTFKLDSLDGRLMNGWLSPDPNQGGALAFWTQHTVAASTGGLGSETRWYEINPLTGALFQNGAAQSSTQFVFNGSIAPDRNGTTAQFGGNLVLDFNTGSTTQLTEAEMVSKVGAAPQSAFVLVSKGTAADEGFDCSQLGGTCRWGDYSGASPDPASTTAGAVWITQMTSSKNSRSQVGWTTFNWEAVP